MKRLNFREAGEQLYLLLHDVVSQCEQGEPMTEELLAKCHKVMADADSVPRLAKLIYGKDAA